MTRLTLNLAPSTSWFPNLHVGLLRRDWNRLRVAVYERAHHRCECCGGVGSTHPVECHELWEYREDDCLYPTQVLAGLVVLCPPCHEVKHFGLAIHRGRRYDAIAHYARVNELSVDAAEVEIKVELNRWVKRSAIEWRLDVSWLADHGIDAVEVTRVAQERRDENARVRDVIAARILNDMLSDLGEPAEGHVRRAVERPCGHVSGFEVPDPDVIENKAARLVYQVSLALRLSECSACNGFDDFGEPEPKKRKGTRIQVVEDDDGRAYDLLA